MSEESVERRLTTILVSDVVGYSRLMAVNEAKGCEILITQKVLSCINGLVEAESLKPLTLKRLAHPVPTFNIVRLKT
jgi:class 3 adenylate cyclase